jgi:hypothetical protein
MRAPDDEACYERHTGNCELRAVGRLRAGVDGEERCRFDQLPPAQDAANSLGNSETAR